MEDIDLHFANVSAFHDRSRQAIVELVAAELLAVTRACGLPAAILTEPDPDKLAPAVANLDLGPPRRNGRPAPGRRDGMALTNPRAVTRG